jgi:hypothetical protein
MTMETGRANPALWMMIAIPAATVVACAFTLWLAYGGAEPELPKRYAWEGSALDRDVARAERARALGLAATLEIGDDGKVTAVVTQEGGATTAGLMLHLTHTTRPRADRSLLLRPTTTPGRYEGRTQDLPAARWLVQLEDERGGWQLRGRLETPAAPVRLGY